MNVSFSFPCKLASLANTRECHWTKAKRAKSQRTQARFNVRMNVGKLGERAMTIKITRVGKRKLDSDNLAISAKHVRDGIADALGLDDGSPLLTWRYEQRVGKVYECHVTIEWSE